MSSKKQAAKKSTTRKPAKAAPAATAKPKAQPERVLYRDQRTYSDEEKALALEAINLAGGNVLAASDQLGIPYRTLLDWSRGDGIPPKLMADFAAKKSGIISDKLVLLRDAIAGEMMSELKLFTAPLKDLATAFGIVTDKLRLMEGKPTSISENRDANADTLQKLIAQVRAAKGLNETDAREWVMLNVPTASKLVM